MTRSEIDTFATRLARFTDKGMALDAAASVADRLMRRDREQDDRRLCKRKQPFVPAAIKANATFQRTLLALMVSYFARGGFKSRLADIFPECWPGVNIRAGNRMHLNNLD